MAQVMYKLAKWPISILLIILLSACAGTKESAKQTAVIDGTQKPDVKTTAPDKRSSLLALDIARKMVGVPYRYGGVDPSGFDCSGLVQYAFNRAGVKLPRTSRDIFRSSQLVSPKDLQPGDLVFFAISSNKISHIGIYVDHNRFIHAPSSGKGVSYASLQNPYWRERLVGVGRF